MSLLGNSAELLEEVVGFVFQAAGLDETMRLRLICQRFDALVQQFVFRLPKDILASKRMCATMKVKLIQSKMLSERSNKLCNAINSTADYLTERMSGQSRKQYVESLVRLAARSMIHWDLVNCLSTAEEKQASPQEIRENALVAAIGAGQHQLVTELLKENLGVAFNTRFFGEALTAAALSGSLATLTTLLQRWQGNDHEHLSDARYMHAVQAAAAAGDEEIVRALLDCGKPFTKSFYDDAIIRIAMTSHACMAKLLLHRRQQHLESSTEGSFWTTLLRTAVEWNNRELLLYLMPEGLSKVDKSTIGLAVEDGCRRGHHESVQILLLALPSFQTRATALHIGGLFWIGRSGIPKSLGFFEQYFQQDIRNITRALAGAISGKRRAHVINLLHYADVDMTTQDPPTRFTDAVHLMLPEAFSTGIEHFRPLEELGENIREACNSDNLVDVIKIFQMAKKHHPNSELLSFSAAYSVAARNNHSDILLYLCENRTPHLITHCASSTSILQVFMNFGWDVNQADPGSKFGRLGNFTHDEHICRWLIDNGASVSARGDWDVTPTSVAVQSATISTIRLFLERCHGVENGQLLHFAIERNDLDVLEVIELLLDLGCPIDGILFQDDPRSWMEVRLGEPGTPLFNAVQKGKTDIVEYLLSKGADAFRPSIRGRTPLDVAESKGHVRIIDLLKQYH